MEFLMTSGANYNYEDMYGELERKEIKKNEFVDYFRLRFMHICLRFPISDKPSNQEIIEWFSYLLYLPKE